MKEHKPIGPRWRDREPSSATEAQDPAARVGAIIRAMKPPPRLSASAHARILGRLRAATSTRGERSTIVRRPAVAAAVALMVGLCGLAAQGSPAWLERSAILRLIGQSPSVEPALSPLSAPATHVTGSPRRLPATSQEADRLEGAPLPDPAPSSPDPAVVAPGQPEASLVTAPRSTPARREREPRPPESPQPGGGDGERSSIAEESRLLAGAVDALRARHDYARALAVLTEYEERFPRGLLADEAKLARLHALVGLGDAAGALALLDGAPARGPRWLEMLVLRGELRANAQRYREAMSDFAGVLSAHAPLAVYERALFGRASAALRMGDARSAEADLRDYLQRFPNGVHAVEARQAVER